MPRGYNTVATLIIVVAFFFSARGISYVASTLRAIQTADLLEIWNLGASRKISQPERWDNEDSATLLAENRAESSAEYDAKERRTEELPAGSWRQEWMWWAHRRYREDDETLSSVRILLFQY